MFKDLGVPLLLKSPTKSAPENNGHDYDSSDDTPDDTPCVGLGGGGSRSIVGGWGKGTIAGHWKAATFKFHAGYIRIGAKETVVHGVSYHGVTTYSVR